MQMWTKEASSKEKNHGVIIVRSHGIRMIHVGSYIESLRIGKRRMREMVVRSKSQMKINRTKFFQITFHSQKNK